VGTTTPVQSISSQKYAHENAVKIVNKRPRNLLNKIQNVFINGKQLKTGKTTQIIRFSRFLCQNNYTDNPPAPTVTFAL